MFSTNDISFFSVVGWAGQTNNNFLSNEDVAQIFEMVRSHKFKTIGIDNVLLRRANFPFNCYSLDLLDDLYEGGGLNDPQLSKT